ncbi:MAG: inositol monophosphatase [Alphaproteobacteria bacterium]|nr:inositol monophosphatase [Alphaproteobacteria bacterium]
MINIDTDKVEAVIRHVAATEVMPRFNTLLQSEIREKKPGDFVTVADEASEKAFTILLQDILPGSLVVGEEAVSKDISVLDKFKEDKPVWVIDPIDGTYNFSHGNSEFGILIALVQNGVTLHGWAFDAPGNRMAQAGKGEGAFLDGKRLKIKCEKTDIKELVGQGGGGLAGRFDSVRPFFKEIVNLRCSLYDIVNFIIGKADFIVQMNMVTPWDHAAACLLAEEAGGIVAMDEDGTAYDPTRFGPAFLIAAPDREWWQKLYPILYPRLHKPKK